MDQHDDDSAVNLITWPFRILITGPCGAGKTSVAIKIMETMASEYKRLIVISPTYLTQRCFRKMDDLIKDPRRDIFPDATKNIFIMIGKQIQRQHDYCEQNGLPSIPTLIFIDDNTSNNAIHGGRMGSLGNLTVTCRHYNASLLCISHQGKAITPGFRNNVTGLIAFPTTNRVETDFISTEFGNMLWTQEQFRRVVIHCWKGGKVNMSEWGKHFIFVLLQPREPTRYFIDFSEEILYDGNE